MTAHTQGRLVVGELNGNSIELKHTNGDVPGAISLVVARVTARQSWLAEADANARRLAACWNAFDAPCMTTPMIEYLIGIGGVNTLSNQAEAMLKEADAARALLEDIARHPFVTADLSDRIRAFLKDHP